MRRVSYAARLARELGGLMAISPAKVRWPGGVVSFTFDDFPRSAWTNGGAVLDKYAVRGTYYTAMGLAGTANHLGPMFGLDDLRAAHAQGHEIACHTYTHRDVMRVPAATIAAEIDENAAALAQALDGFAATNFAFPFGGLSQHAKRALGGRFDTCRGVGQGINNGTVDMADLRSTSLYARDFDRDRLCQLIDDAQALDGWLTFYTHDVSETPSDFGCTPDQLRAVVAYAAENVTVLPVSGVVAGLRDAREHRAAA